MYKEYVINPDVANFTIVRIKLDDENRWVLTEFLRNKERHCTTGPAFEYNTGHKEWWVGGKLHREDGPAIEFVGGGKRWYLDGIQLASEDKYNEELLKRKNKE
jgi:hypothetical protein